MITLSAATKQIKNALWDTGEWIVLFTFKSKDESIVFYLCNNTENITFKGTEYIAFPLQADEIKESNKGELPSINITMSNVERLVQSYVENDPNYGSGWSIHVDIVHTTNIANGISEVNYDFVSMGASATAKFVVFECGMRNPLRQQFPRIRMLPNACQNEFKKNGCTYSGTDTSCQKTRSACLAKFPDQPSIPFLGFPSIPTSGMYP